MAGLFGRSDPEHALALAQTGDFRGRQRIKTSPGGQEVLGDERRPHEPLRLVIASGEQDVTHFVRKDPSQRTPNVRRLETRATQQSAELFETQGAEQLLGRLQVDIDRHVVNGAKRQVRAPQDPVR